MGGADARVNAPAHRLDESPVGYSLAGWSPPEPASASPTRSSILQNGPDGRKIFIADESGLWGQKHAKFFGNISE
jgi:hypothetical protein